MPEASLAQPRPDAPSPEERRARALERIDTVLRWTAGAVALAALLWLLGDVVLLVFAAALLAAGLRGAAVFVGRHTGLGTGLSLLAVVLALLLGFGAAAWWFGPSLVAQATDLQQQLTEQAKALRDWLQGTGWGRALLHQLPPSLGGEGGGSIGEVLSPRLAGTVAGVLSSTIGALGTLVLVVAAALYFAASPTPYVNGALRLLPPRHRGRARPALARIGHTLQAWLGGQIVDMLAVGVVTGLGLWAIGVPLWPVLGLIAGLLNFIPYIGAIGGAVPALLVALAGGPEQVLLVAALFTVVQTVEGNILSPLIQKQAVDLPPAATILAQTTIGTLFGLPGVVLATPVAAALLTLGQEITEPVEDGKGK